MRVAQLCVGSVRVGSCGKETEKCQRVYLPADDGTRQTYISAIPAVNIGSNVGGYIARPTGNKELYPLD